MTNDGRDLLDIDPAGNPADGNGAPSANSTDPGPAGNGDPVPGSNDFGTNWKDYIPEDLKDRSEWNNIKDPSNLFTNYIHQTQTISKSVRIPDETSSPEDIAKFYSKLGKPASKNDYDFEYIPANENYVYKKDSFDFGVFKDIADEANLTTDQYKKMATAYLNITNENYINYNKALESKAGEELKSAESKLRSAWGDQYTQNINAISEKVKKLYPEATLTRMQNAGLFRDPEFLQSHLKLTKMMTGDTVFIEGNAVENVPQTLQNLQDKRDKLMADDYEKNRQEVLNLNQQIVKLKQSQSAGAAKFHG